jgi:hypothetical protein
MADLDPSKYAIYSEKNIDLDLATDKVINSYKKIITKI